MKVNKDMSLKEFNSLKHKYKKENKLSLDDIDKLSSITTFENNLLPFNAKQLKYDFKERELFFINSGFDYADFEYYQNNLMDFDTVLVIANEKDIEKQSIKKEFLRNYNAFIEKEKDFPNILLSEYNKTLGENPNNYSVSILNNQTLSDMLTIRLFKEIIEANHPLDFLPRDLKINLLNYLVSIDFGKLYRLNKKLEDIGDVEYINSDYEDINSDLLTPYIKKNNKYVFDIFYKDINNMETFIKELSNVLYSYSLQGFIFSEIIVEQHIKIICYSNKSLKEENKIIETVENNVSDFIVKFENNKENYFITK